MVYPVIAGVKKLLHDCGFERIGASSVWVRSRTVLVEEVICAEVLNGQVQAYAGIRIRDADRFAVHAAEIIAHLNWKGKRSYVELPPILRVSRFWFIRELKPQDAVDWAKSAISAEFGAVSDVRSMAEFIASDLTCFRNSNAALIVALQMHCAVKLNYSFWPRILPDVVRQAVQNGILSRLSVDSFLDSVWQLALLDAGEGNSGQSGT